MKHGTVYISAKPLGSSWSALVFIPLLNWLEFLGWLQLIKATKQVLLN